MGGSIFADDIIIDLEREKDRKKGNDEKDDEEYKNIVGEKILGVAFLKRDNPRK